MLMLLDPLEARANLGLGLIDIRPRERWDPQYGTGCWILSPKVRTYSTRSVPGNHYRCWVLKTQHELETEPAWPIQYGYAIKRRAK
jgi:hypothetical protein